MTWTTRCLCFLDHAAGLAQQQLSRTIWFYSKWSPACFQCWAVVAPALCSSNVTAAAAAAAAAAALRQAGRQTDRAACWWVNTAPSSPQHTKPLACHARATKKNNLFPSDKKTITVRCVADTSPPLSGSPPCFLVEHNQHMLLFYRLACWVWQNSSLWTDDFGWAGTRCTCLWPIDL